MSARTDHRRRIVALLTEHPGLTARQIAAELALDVLVVRVALSHRNARFRRHVPVGQARRKGIESTYTVFGDAPLMAREEIDDIDNLGPVSWLSGAVAEGAGFHCDKLGRHVSFAVCIESYTVATASFARDAGPCQRCQFGAKRRAAYAAGEKVS